MRTFLDDRTARPASPVQAGRWGSPPSGYLFAAQAQKHVTVNEALRLLDGLVQLAVLDRHLTAPPASPADGDRGS
jgi:hypothetical protein